MFSLANEHQGVRGFFDEGYSGESLIGAIPERHLRGTLYRRDGLQGHLEPLGFMVNTVNWLYTRIEVDGETLDLAKSKFSDFRRELDFRTGELRREFIWETSIGQEIATCLFAPAEHGRPKNWPASKSA